MLRTMIICPDPQASQELQSAIAELNAGVEVTRVSDRYLVGMDLLRALRAHAPDVLFLSFEDATIAIETVRFLDVQSPGLQLVAINRTCDASMLRESMRAGIREFLTSPFEPHALAEALSNVQRLLEKKPVVYETTNEIVSFLPSKAGSGTTTLALNVANALARGKKQPEVLLTDLDLNSGMVRFLLKLRTEYSIVDALENMAEMDENIWPQLITRQGGLDVLHAGRVNPNLRVDPANIHNLVQFLRRNYRSLVFDLSGNLERYSLEVMQESRRVFLVCTPEIPSLHLAREKMGFLKTMGLDSKVYLLLNRATKRPLFTVSQVEELVGANVIFTFSNDYFAVSRATTAGQCLDPESLIGQQCAAFANALAEPRAASPERRKKFLEFFNVNAGTPVAAAD